VCISPAQQDICINSGTNDLHPIQTGKWNLKSFKNRTCNRPFCEKDLCECRIATELLNTSLTKAPSHCPLDSATKITRGLFAVCYPRPTKRYIDGVEHIGRSSFFFFQESSVGEFMSFFPGLCRANTANPAPECRRTTLTAQCTTGEGVSN